MPEKNGAPAVPVSRTGPATACNFARCCERVSILILAAIRHTYMTTQEIMLSATIVMAVAAVANTMSTAIYTVISLRLLKQSTKATAITAAQVRVEFEIVAFSPSDIAVCFHVEPSVTILLFDIRIPFATVVIDTPDDLNRHITNEKLEIHAASKHRLDESESLPMAVRAGEVIHLKWKNSAPRAGEEGAYGLIELEYEFVGAPGRGNYPLPFIWSADPESASKLNKSNLVIDITDSSRPHVRTNPDALSRTAPTRWQRAMARITQRRE